MDFTHLKPSLARHPCMLRIGGVLSKDLIPERSTIDFFPICRKPHLVQLTYFIVFKLPVGGRSQHKDLLIPSSFSVRRHLCTGQPRNSEKLTSLGKLQPMEAKECIDECTPQLPALRWSICGVLYSVIRASLRDEPQSPTIVTVSLSRFYCVLFFSFPVPLSSLLLASWNQLTNKPSAPQVLTWIQMKAGIQVKVGKEEERWPKIAQTFPHAICTFKSVDKDASFQICRQ